MMYALCYNVFKYTAEFESLLSEHILGLGVPEFIFNVIVMCFFVCSHSE